PLVPVAKFRSGVDQRVYVPTLEEWIAREFKMTALQRQSFEWGAKCCGLNLLPIFKGLDEALERRKARKTREKIQAEIRRDLALIEEARKQAGLPDKR
ncbi:MAG TPA: hypothetical protein VFX49_01045, partial [Chloroflexota bacterium]|nr:hypothetical protein [Chloroflexota bacterium]